MIRKRPGKSAGEWRPFLVWLCVVLLLGNPLLPAGSALAAGWSASPLPAVLCGAAPE